MKIQIHMDDPPWDIFGLPRLMVDEAACEKLLTTVDHPCNCLTLCTGSLNANPENNCADIIRKYHARIAFAHICNIHHFPNGTSPKMRTGTAAVKPASLRFCVPTTIITGRATSVPTTAGTCGEKAPAPRPGYGLYDRALGIMYMLGVWDMLDRLDGKN